MASQTAGLQALASSNNEALLKLTRIAFASVEKLTALNLNATRTALESSLSRAGSLLQSRDPEHPAAGTGAATVAAAQQAQTYLHELQKITADTQKQVAELLSGCVYPVGLHAQGNDDWSTAFGMLKAFAEQMNTLTDLGNTVIRDTAGTIARAQGPA